MKPLTFLMSIGLFVIAALGCENSTVTDSVTKESNVSEDVEHLRFRVFTGRDSIGVALFAKVSATAEGALVSDGCSEMVGTGFVTHLGKSVVIQNACIDGDGNIWGEFEYEGRTGGHISGGYEGTIDESELEADVTIETVGGINSLPEELPEGIEKWGRGTMEGTLSNSELNYDLDGWLFHHENKEPGNIGNQGSP